MMSSSAYARGDTSGTRTIEKVTVTASTGIGAGAWGNLSVSVSQVKAGDTVITNVVPSETAVLAFTWYVPSAGTVIIHNFDVGGSGISRNVTYEFTILHFQ